MELMYNAYVLTKKELSFLAGAMGTKRLYGILDDDEPDEAELYSILSGLIRKGFVVPEDESFVIDKEIKAMIEIMSGDEFPVFVKDPHGAKPAKCIYIVDHNAVVCEQSHTSEHELRLYALKADEARSLISEMMQNERTMDDDID